MVVSSFCGGYPLAMSKLINVRYKKVFFWMMDDLVLLSGQISKHIENTTKYHHIKNNTKYHHIGNTTTYHHHFFPPRIVVFNKILDPLCTNNVDYMVATVNGGSIFGWANRHKVWRLKD